MENIDKETYRKIIDENVRVHDQEAPIYDNIHSDANNFAQRRRVNKFVERIFADLQPEEAMILDLGCGTGFLTLNFAQRNCKKCIGVDLSENMLDQLKRKIEREHIHNIEIYKDDIDSFLDRCDQKFDVISFSSVLHHLPDYQQTINNAISFLKRNGYIYITREPVLQKPDSKVRFFFHRLLANIDWIVHRSILFIKGFNPPPVRYGYAHYQQEKYGGIDQNYLLKFFKNKGFEIILFEKYCVRFLGIFSLIASKIIRSENDFQLLVKKSTDDNS